MLIFRAQTDISLYPVVRFPSILIQQIRHCLGYNFAISFSYYLFQFAIIIFLTHIFEKGKISKGQKISPVRKYGFS